MNTKGKRTKLYKFSPDRPPIAAKRNTSWLRSIKFDIAGFGLISLEILNSVGKINSVYSRQCRLFILYWCSLGELQYDSDLFRLAFKIMGEGSIRGFIMFYPFFQQINQFSYLPAFYHSTIGCLLYSRNCWCRLERKNKEINKHINSKLNKQFGCFDTIFWGPHLSFTIESQTVFSLSDRR